MFDKKCDAGQAEQKHGLHTPPNDSPPPSYAVNDDSGIPDITAAFSNLDLKTTDKPTVDQCIAHLKLLEAFHQLREDVATQDGLFGLQDSFVSSKTGERERAELLVKIREKRWEVFVTKAAARFQRWWEVVIEPDARMLQQSDIPTAFAQDFPSGKVLSFDTDRLPPLGESGFMGFMGSMVPVLYITQISLFRQMSSWSGMPTSSIPETSSKIASGMES